MEVQVRVPSPLRELAAGQSMLTLSLDERCTVGDLLDGLGAAHPALERRIRDEQGTLRAHVNLFVGGENLKDLHGKETVLHPGDEVSILAAISGG